MPTTPSRTKARKRYYEPKPETPHQFSVYSVLDGLGLGRAEKNMIRIGILLWALVLIGLAATIIVKQFQSENAISLALTNKDRPKQAVPIMPAPKKKPPLEYNRLYPGQDAEDLRMSNPADLQFMLNNKPAGFDRPYRTN